MEVHHLMISNRVATIVHGGGVIIEKKDVIAALRVNP